jgi:putative hydrolase of the HAD superfamily
VSRGGAAAAVRAVFFDVDFTLIRPGPTFGAEGYRAFCARHGMEVDAGAFADAVAGAASILEDPPGPSYDAEVFVRYTREIIERMGGRGPGLDECAREIYREWAACQHFELYDEVPAVLRTLTASGIRTGLISNSHRCLASFQAHFELRGLIAAAVSSSEHGLMKPHAGIFREALRLVGVPAAASLMVGDSLRHDVEGALGAGMRAVLLYRGEDLEERRRELAPARVPVIASLSELLPLVLAPGRCPGPPTSLVGLRRATEAFSNGRRPGRLE